MGTSIATVQIHDEVVVGFPRFIHIASSLGRESRSDSLGPRLANSPTLVVLVRAPFVFKLFGHSSFAIEAYKNDPSLSGLANLPSDSN